MDRKQLTKQEGTPVLGFREARKVAEEGGASLAVVASNCPEDHRKALEKAGVEVREFDGNSKELGVVYGKPFNVSVVSFRED